MKFRLIEMAITRADAIEECMSLGKKFIEHFRKAYKEPNAEVLNHWCNEMQGWYNKVKGIKLKQDNKPLLDGNIRDWFFTVGADAEDFIDNREETEFYDKFCSYLLIYNDTHKAFEQARELFQK